jgi:transcriptional regulator with XRE-family HTH domain
MAADPGAGDVAEIVHEISVGRKLKHARLLRSLTLKQLADAAGCSESLLSKIENGKTNPSLRMVHRLAAALGTTVATLFEDHDGAHDVVQRRGHRPFIETNRSLGGRGVKLESLIPTRGYLLSGFINHIEAGGGSDGDVQHEGEEFGYVLEGEIEIDVDGTRYLVGPGDSFSFRSERKHSYRNPGRGIARVLWINTPPTF